MWLLFLAMSYALSLPQASLPNSIEGDRLTGVPTAVVSPVTSSELPVQQPDHVEEPVHKTTTQPEGQVVSISSPPPTSEAQETESRYPSHLTLSLSSGDQYKEAIDSLKGL